MYALITNAALYALITNAALDIYTNIYVSKEIKSRGIKSTWSSLTWIPMLISILK